MAKYSFSGLALQHMHLQLFLEHSTAQDPGVLLWRYHEGAIPPKIFHSDSFRGTYTRSSWQSFNHSQVLNPFDSMQLLQQQSSISLLRFMTETSSSTCAPLARLRQPTFTFGWMRTRVKLPEPPSTHSLWKFFTAVLAGILTQIEKQLKLISSSLRFWTQTWNHIHNNKANA